MQGNSNCVYTQSYQISVLQEKKKKLNSDNHVVFFLFTVLPSKLIQLHFAFSTKYFGAV